MSEVTERLASAGYELPSAPDALGSYVPAVRTGQLVFTAGQLPLKDGRLLASGLVGSEVGPAEARRSAEQAALNALAAASTVCDLDDVDRVVKVTGYIASAEGFTAHPAVVDGASAVILAAFGDAGRHARAAVGVCGLPMGSPVEIEIILALR
jgi:enamine deaminase RidA (YjgF/YER057c/UK114 family)